MKAHLFSTSRRDLQPEFGKLAALLPSEVVASATLFAIDAVDDNVPLPRYVATTGELSDEQTARLEAAVAGLVVTDLELQLGEARTAPNNGPPTADVLPPSFFGATAAALQAADAARIEPTETLKQIMEGKASGIDYPEKAWTGALREAYDVFVQRLGKAPMDDKGSFLEPDDVRRAAQDRPAHIDAGVWIQVADHLARELKLYGLAAKWFSISGYLHSLYTEHHIFSSDFVRVVNDKYLKLGSSKTVSIGLDICMQLTVRAVGTIKEYGTGLGAALSALWTVTKASLPDPHATINASIAEMQNRVIEIFANSLATLTKADKALGGDWGLLDKFGLLLEKGTLVWPRDLSGLRAAQARSFQYVALQSTVHLLSGMHNLCRLDIGVVDVQRKVKDKQSGAWSGTHYLTHSVYSKGGTCGVGKGWYLREVYLGYSVIAPGASSLLRQDADPALQEKLFGHKIDDPADPQFALTQGFLLDPASPLRKGWNLGQLHFAG